MRIGLQLPNFTWTGGANALAMKLAQIVRTAEQAGFASLWVMDHFFQIDIVGPPDTDMLEAYSTLTYVAALTGNMRLGTMVTGVSYRHPGLLIKTATTLDVLSGGRAYLGIGAGWYEREHRGLGVPFPPLNERFARLEETLRIARQMWSSDNGPFQGTHYRLDETLCVPQPLSRPHLPILIGGLGERKTLRLVAQYADACNLFDHVGVEVLRHKLSVLRDHCAALNRDYDEIECSSLGKVELRAGKQSSAEIIEHCQALAEVGIQHAIFYMPNVEDIAPLEEFGRDIIPAVSSFE